MFARDLSISGLHRSQLSPGSSVPHAPREDTVSTTHDSSYLCPCGSTLNIEKNPSRNSESWGDEQLFCLLNLNTRRQMREPWRGEWIGTADTRHGAPCWSKLQEARVPIVANCDIWLLVVITLTHSDCLSEENRRVNFEICKKQCRPEIPAYPCWRIWRKT